MATGTQNVIKHNHVIYSCNTEQEFRDAVPKLKLQNGDQLRIHVQYANDDSTAKIVTFVYCHFKSEVARTCWTDGVRSHVEFENNVYGHLLNETEHGTYNIF